MEHSTQKPLTSVHEALNHAVFVSKTSSGPVTSFRVDEALKEAASAICERNGTNLSDFLRQCMVGLVNDYSDPSRG